MTALWVLVIRFAPGKVDNATHLASKTLKLITLKNYSYISMGGENPETHGPAAQ